MAEDVVNDFIWEIKITNVCERQRKEILKLLRPLLLKDLDGKEHEDALELNMNLVATM